MADNRADTRVSMRTPLARVKGLGASGHGVEHWWLHRMTAVSNVPLIIAFVIIVAALAGTPSYSGGGRHHLASARRDHPASSRSSR